MPFWKINEQVFRCFFLFAHDFLAAAVTENTENAAELKSEDTKVVQKMEVWVTERNGVKCLKSLRWCSVMCLQPFHHFHFAMFSSHALILVPFVLHVDMIISPVHTHNIIQAHANNIIKIFLKRYCSNNNLVCALAHVCQSLFWVGGALYYSIVLFPFMNVSSFSAFLCNFCARFWHKLFFF